MRDDDVHSRNNFFFFIIFTKTEEEEEKERERERERVHSLCGVVVLLLLRNFTTPKRCRHKDDDDSVRTRAHV